VVPEVKMKLAELATLGAIMPRLTSGVPDRQEQTVQAADYGGVGQKSEAMTAVTASLFHDWHARR
jgi:hypothetical protein